jgi:hypothetical protein
MRINLCKKLNLQEIDLKGSFVLASVALLSFLIGGNIIEYLIKKELVIMIALIRESFMK